MLTSVNISANRTQRVSLIEHHHYCFLWISANIQAVLLLCKLQIAPWNFPQKVFTSKGWVLFYFESDIFYLRCSSWTRGFNREEFHADPGWNSAHPVLSIRYKKIKNISEKKEGWTSGTSGAIIQCARINGEGFKYLQTQIAQVFFASGCLIIALTRWWIHNDVTVPTHTISFLMWLLLSGICGFPLWTPQVSHIFFLSL